MPQKHLFSWLQIKVRQKGLHSFAFSTLNFKFSSTTVENPLQISPLIMQNKANFPDDPMKVCTAITKDYENKTNCKLGQNKPNTKPIKPNSCPPSVWRVSAQQC